jgi:hypothetical protein
MKQVEDGEGDLSAGTLTSETIAVLARYAGLPLTDEDGAAVLAQLTYLLPELRERHLRDFDRLPPAFVFRAPPSP